VRRPLAYLDADVFINVMKRERTLWPRSLGLLLAVERGDLRLVANRLLAVEVGRHRGDVEQDKVEDFLYRWLVQVDVQWWELDLRIEREARRLSHELGLAAQDAVHLATAVLARADYFITRDLKFPLGADVEGVAVREPDVLWAPTTEDEELRTALEAETAPPKKVVKAKKQS